MKKRWKKLLCIAASAVVLLGIVSAVLVWNGVILLNGLSARGYAVKGVDVSSYQGKIDWNRLAAEDIQFAFIKATEGSTHVDGQFAENFRQAQATHLAVGAYHFFSYDSPGAAQAEHFIQTVTPFDGMLPPVVDLEFYGDYEDQPPKKETVDSQLKAMLSALETEYHLKPIIYATEKSYELYLSEGYGDYDIWIRSVITTPDLCDDRDWTFWQYANRGRLAGYEGDEEYIDLNVFHGTAEQFQAYPRY